MRARKAGAKLLTDTLDLPNDGGISERSHKWLKKTFEKGKLLNTEAKREADEVARKCAVNYIAVSSYTPQHILLPRTSMSQFSAALVEFLIPLLADV